MKQSFIILTLLLNTVSFGQNSTQRNSFQKIYDKVSGLTLSDTLKASDIVGIYYTSNGFAGYKFQLNSNLTFYQNGFDCVSNSKIDSGNWVLQNGNILVIKSSKTTKVYDIIKLDKFYFLILQTQKQKFIKDLVTIRNKLKKTKPFIHNDKTYSKDYLIGRSLVKKYYAKEIDDFTGT